MTPEGKVKKKVREWLSSNNIYLAVRANVEAKNGNAVNGWFYAPVHTGYGESGLPDFVCCIKGQFVGIETKARGKKLSPRQKQVQDAVRKTNGIHIVVEGEENVGEQLEALEGILKDKS